MKWRCGLQKNTQCFYYNENNEWLCRHFVCMNEWMNSALWLWSMAVFAYSQHNTAATVAECMQSNDVNQMLSTRGHVAIDRSICVQLMEIHFEWQKHWGTYKTVTTVWRHQLWIWKANTDKTNCAACHIWHDRLRPIVRCDGVKRALLRFTRLVWNSPIVSSCIRFNSHKTQNFNSRFIVFNAH